MGVGRVTRRAKEVFISKSVRPYRVSASTVVTLHYCYHPALSRMTVYRNQLSRSSQPWSSWGPAPVLLHCICRLLAHRINSRQRGTSVAFGAKRKIDAAENGSRLVYERTRLFPSSAGRHGALLFICSSIAGWATSQTSSSPRMKRRASSVLGS